jgi:lysophospholipase L1-like esterase
MKSFNWALLIVGIVVLAVGFAVAFQVLSAPKEAGPVRVACVGDSITSYTDYPADLQALLGPSYEVGSFGIGGATILLNTDRPYLNQAEFQQAKQFRPDVVVILLGTNDARTNIYQSSENLESDYKTLIGAFQNFGSKPEVWLAIPPPIFNNTLSLSTSNFVEGVIPRIETVANELHLPRIDVYGALMDHPEYFPDGVHPDGEGAQLIAKTVYTALNP